MHHECIHQCTINALITASSMHRASCNTSSMHSLHQMHQFRSFSSSFHHQCIVSAFINASPMYSSVYSSLHHQGNPSMHHQCFVNTLSMPSPTNHQPIVSAFVNASSMHSSMHLVINIPSMHHHCIKCINSFFHLLNSFKLVHLHCCSFIRFFVAVTLSAFLLSFLNSLYPFNSFFRPSFLRSLFVPVFSHLLLYYFCASLILDLIPYTLGRYLAVLIHNFMLWRKNPQCSATCCITMLLSLNELTSGVNSVASMRKTNFRTNLGMGGVDMPSMRSAVNDNVGFEIEGKEEDIKGKKDKVTDTRGVRFTDVKGPTDEMLSNNIIRRGIPEGRRFSSRFPARQIRASNS